MVGCLTSYWSNTAGCSPSNLGLLMPKFQQELPSCSVSFNTEHKNTSKFFQQYLSHKILKIHEACGKFGIVITKRIHLQRWKLSTICKWYALNDSFAFQQFEYYLKNFLIDFLDQFSLPCLYCSTLWGQWQTMNKKKFEYWTEKDNDSWHAFHKLICAALIVYEA